MAQTPDDSRSWLRSLAGRPRSVATVGDNCVDIYRSSGRTVVGGNAVNVAIDLAHAGLPATFFGRVGADEDGRRIATTLLKAGAASRETVTDAPTCRAFLEVAEDGTTTLVGTEGNCDYARLDEPELAALEGFGIVYMKGVAEADAAIAALRVRGVVTAYDYSTFHEETGTAAADIAIYSVEDDDLDGILTLLRRAASRGARLAIATRGSQGAVGLFDGEVIETPAHAVEVVDTIGAGDAFAAALLAALLDGEPVLEALRAGAREGSLTCTFEGAWRSPALNEALG